MLEFIDADQLLEIYGGTLKMPSKMWPPIDTYSPADRLSRQAVNPPAKADSPYVFEPTLNCPRRALFGPKPIVEQAPAVEEVKIEPRQSSIQPTIYSEKQPRESVGDPLPDDLINDIKVHLPSPVISEAPDFGNGRVSFGLRPIPVKPLNQLNDEPSPASHSGRLAHTVNKEPMLESKAHFSKAKMVPQDPKKVKSCCCTLI